MSAPGRETKLSDEWGLQYSAAFWTLDDLITELGTGWTASREQAEADVAASLLEAPNVEHLIIERVKRLAP